MGNCPIMNRMKGYESSWDITLPRRLPVIVRVDIVCGHNYCKDLGRPISPAFIEVMNEVGRELSLLPTVELTFQQSDEISLLIHGYKKLVSEPWYGNRKSKLESITAGIASAVLTANSHRINGAIKKGWFDSRAFVLPESEVCNYFIARQKDATRNSIQMLGQSLFSHKELHKKSQADIQEMCFQKGINWNDWPTHWKRGRCFIKGELDNEIPIFTQDRNYIEKHLQTEDT